MTPRKKLFLFLIVFPVVLPLGVWVYDKWGTIQWVGSTDLEIVFAVTDAESGEPVPDARIEIERFGGFGADGDPREFVLSSDSNGYARKLCRNTMCFGTQSQLRFTNTHVVHLPFGHYRAIAPGYEPTEWTPLDDYENVRMVKRHAPRRTRLTLPIAIRRERK